MQEGMFLGYKVNTNGLKVCPDKADAVLSLPSPRCLKDVQKLNGKLASLNRFLSKSAEKSLPFFKTLKKCTKKSDFQWTQEAEAAFKQMKKLIAELSMLTAPKEKEELIIYLAAAKEAISAVLMTERVRQQSTIIFVSQCLRAGGSTQPHGKIGVSFAQCKQAAEKILPSTRNHCNHGSADKATIVKLRNQWEDAKVEV
ncbi:reverse transcriptase domain-containing protein [Tanacetum coccineum]